MIKKSEKENIKIRAKIFWVLINSYIVKDEDYKQAIAFLKNKNFMGRWLSEPSESYQLYNREYYWSEIYNFFKNPYYNGEAWVEFDKYDYDGATDLKVLLPTNIYSSERKADTLYSEHNCSWYKPCEEIFKYFNMQYGKGNSILYDSDDQIVCFDSSELLNESIGFFIDEKLLKDFLRDNKYRIIWTLVSKKNIVSKHYDNTYKQPTSSKVCVCDNEKIQEIYSVKIAITN